VDAHPQFAVLGPVRAWRDGTELSLGSPQQRLTLALLLLREGQPVSVDEIADALWGYHLPRGARGTIRTYVYRLRRLLEQDGAEPVIVSAGGGYALRIPPGALDLTRYHLEAGRAATAHERGNFAVEARHLHNALREWTGVPLAGLSGSIVDDQRHHLEQLRVATLERLMTARLELGQHAEVIATLSAAVAAHPLYERFRELQMLALHRAGRSAEALVAYERVRTHLRDELGADPGPALQQLHRQILRAGLPERSPAPVAPAQLPAELPVFVGRDDVLAQLLELDPEEHPVVALSGMAGVGKTALALHWAHRVADRFPDGQLYVNLRGFDPTAAETAPAEALRGFLTALGVAPHQVPDEQAARAALFRSLLSGRRVLVLLDNARGTEQVLPLLPASRGSLTVVTSRHQLAGLVTTAAAHPVSLGLMAPDEAVRLLTRRLGAARVTAEPGAAGEIAELCGRLPLALAVTAARAALRPHFSLAAIAADLRAARGSLDRFAATDPHGDVRAVFSCSLRTLSPAAARLFRLLAVHPGPDLGIAAAAAVAGKPVRATGELLAELTEANLLTEHSPHRYQWHDLVRAYANDSLGDEPPADRDAATRRLLDHYLHTASAADRFYTMHHDFAPLEPPAEGTPLPPLTDYDQAAAWFATEYQNLLALTAAGTAAGFPAHTWRLAWALRHVQDRRGDWHDFAATQRLAMAAAESLGDRTALAYANRGAARAATMRGSNVDAQRQLETALELFGEEGAVLARAYTLRQLARACQEQGRLQAAFERAGQSLALFRQAVCPVGEAAALNVLGYYHAHLGRPAETLRFCRQALALFSALGERFGQAETWHSLGFAYHALGRQDEGIRCYRRALALFQRLEGREDEADTLARLGAAHTAAGQVAKARQVLHQALAILTELDLPDAARVRDALRELDREDRAV
jgi:DNA-binding SARP family transcriptional activator